MARSPSRRVGVHPILCCVDCAIVLTAERRLSLTSDIHVDGLMAYVEPHVLRVTISLQLVMKAKIAWHQPIASVSCGPSKSTR